MAIESNDSNEQVVKASGIQMYTGVTTVKVLAVNPSMEQLHAINVNVKQEPEYFVEINGVDYFKLIFWVTNGEMTTRVEFLLADTPQVTQAGDKFQWLNSVSPIQDTWSAEAPQYDWWKSEGQRKAYRGEVKLMKFVQAWANVAGGGMVSFDTIDKIVKGDITEVKQLVAALQNNEVRILLGVKDSKYQDVYMNYFGRIKPQRDDFFVKPLNDEYTKFNADYDPSLEYGEYVPKVQTAISADTDAVPAEADDWIS